MGSGLSLLSSSSHTSLSSLSGSYFSSFYFPGSFLPQGPCTCYFFCIGDSSVPFLSSYLLVILQGSAQLLPLHTPQGTASLSHGHLTFPAVMD